MENNKIIMQHGNLRIAAEVYHDGGYTPAEMCVYLCDENGNPTQDICMVHPAHHYKKGKWVTDENFVDCLVWGDSESEDYTHKHTIGVYKEEGN